MTTTPVRAKGLRVEIGGYEILRGIDLEVTSGEVVAILGANGSGKSTLVRALVGVVPHQGGTIELFGTPLGAHAELDRIGYVPQRISAGAGVTATAGEVVTSGLLHRHRLRPPRDARERVREALLAVGLDHHAARPVTQLSGGQQQRVLIARALVRRPDLLVLDEPVAGVDLPSQEAFAATLTRLADAGTTIVVVLHELGNLAGLIQRAVVLRHGVAVHDGVPPVAARDHALAEHDHVHPHESVRTASDTSPELRLQP